MFKLIGISAGLLAISLGGAADDDAASPQSQARQPGDPAAGGATASKREQEYLSALKKCEPMSGTERSKCVDAARKRYGQM